jgi:hypothetical protein
LIEIASSAFGLLAMTMGKIVAERERNISSLLQVGDVPRPQGYNMRGRETSHRYYKLVMFLDLKATT